MRFIHVKVRSQADEDIGLVIAMEYSLKISVNAILYSYKKARKKNISVTFNFNFSSYIFIDFLTIFNSALRESISHE